VYLKAKSPFEMLYNHVFLLLLLFTNTGLEGYPLQLYGNFTCDVGERLTLSNKLKSLHLSQIIAR